MVANQSQKHEVSHNKLDTIQRIVYLDCWGQRHRNLEEGYGLLLWLPRKRELEAQTSKKHDPLMDEKDM